MKRIYTAQEIYNGFFDEHSDFHPWSTFRLVSILGTKKVKK